MHSRRVIFIDLARAVAVIFMLYGHAVDALLAPDYRRGVLYDVWLFQRGLTSCLFLLLSGFAFSIATSRHWPAHIAPSPALIKRARRFGLFILLGYALHFPVDRVIDLRQATDEQWRQLLAVDVLQLIGATFLGIQLLVLLLRSRRLFMVVTLVIAGALTAATPALWAIDWVHRLPLWLASYLTSATGSQFPVAPWAMFILVGAGLGQIYARWGATHLTAYANYALLIPGVALVALSSALATLPATSSGAPGADVPPQVAIRTGACLIIVGGVAHASRRLSKLPHVFGALAQESLLIYFVHLCIVYGSIWNLGLAQRFGATLGPGDMVVTVLALIASMTALAWYWNWWKHTRPRAARWTAVGAGALLLSRLL